MFRQEAFDYQKTKWTGKALLISGFPPWVIATVSLAVIIIFLVFITLGTYTRRINVYGEVTTLPQAINIFASHQGFITQSLVKVGDEVEVFGPSTSIQRFTIESIINEKNESVMVANHPEEKLFVKIPFEVKENDILRVPI